ncbi:MAG: (p)ppGpp synthetase, partial [Cloacibacillus sp.]
MDNMRGGDEKMNTENNNKKAPAPSVRSAHLTEIANMSGFSMGEKESRALMESFWGRIAEEQRVPSLRLAWQDLWSKAALYLTKEDMMTVGETFVYSSVAHGAQRRYTGEPYIIHTVSVAAILCSMEIDRVTIVASLL